jgi:hypothetical protein
MHQGLKTPGEDHMELIWIGIVILVLAALVIGGILWAGMSARARRHGADRQPYQRPPHGSPDSTRP